MRIGFLLPHSKIAGGIKVMCTYARELSRLGHEVVIIVREESRIEAVKNTYFRKDFAWFSTFPKNVTVKYMPLSGIRSFVDSFDGDALIGDAWHMAAVLAASGTRAKRFHIIQHDERMYHGSASEIERVYKEPLHKIVVASWLKEMLQRDFGADSILLLNSFDRDIYMPKKDGSDHDGFLRIIMLDHPYAWKGTEAGIALIRSIKGNYPHVRLVGYGARETKHTPHYDEYHFGKTDRELADIYRKSDIYLCTSWDEGFGLSSLEAMACGTALVTYDNGGSRDFAFDMKTALVAPRGDTEAFRRKLITMIEDGALRNELAAAGSRYVASMPTWQDAAERLVAGINEAS